jgi:hypothetical protein
MKHAISPSQRHLCPDCHSEETQGQDKFGFPMPCARCLVERLVKAFHADMEDQTMLASRRSAAGEVHDSNWSRQLA